MVKLQDYTATEKEEVSLDCELSKDVPVVWYHSEKEIIASKLMVMKSEGTRRSLILKKAEQSNRGQYVCDCGTDKTSANINIEGIRGETVHVLNMEVTLEFISKVFLLYCFSHLQLETSRWSGQFMVWSFLTERQLASRWRSLRKTSTASGS